MERLEERRKDFEARGAHLAALSVDSIETSQALAEKKKLGFPILADPDRIAINAFGVVHAGKDIALPAVFVIDPGGVIRWRRVSSSVGDRPTEDEILDVVSRVKGSG